MPGEGIEQSEKAGLVGGNEKTHETLRFVIKSHNPIGWRVSHGQKCAERNQLARRNRVGIRFREIPSSALITGVRILGNILRESFIQPGWNTAGVKTVQHQVDDFVSQNVVREFVFRVALNEQAALRMNPAGPGFQASAALKLPPLFRIFEDVDVRFNIGRRGDIPLELFGHDAIVKLRFHGNGGGDVTVDEMVNEMLGLAVFPLRRIDGESNLAKWIGITLTQLRKLDLR